MTKPAPVKRPISGRWNRTLATVGYLVLLAGVLPIFNLGWLFVVVGLGFLLLGCYEPGHGYYLIGPLTALEARPPLRRRAVWIKRIVILFMASLVLFWQFNGYDVTDINRVAEANNRFVTIVGIGLVLYVFIIGLNTFTNQVHRYKSGKQWEVLRTTDLRQREIVSGLILGKFPLILEPVLTVTPIMMVMPLFGGVSPWFPLIVLLAAVCLGLNVATISTYCSLKRKTSAGAAGMVWAVYGVYALVSWIAVALIQRKFLPNSEVLQWFVSGFGWNFSLSSIKSVETMIVSCLLESCSFHAMVSLLFFLLATLHVAGRQRLEASSEKSAKVADQPRRKRIAVRRVKLWNKAPIAWWQAMHWMNWIQSGVNRNLTWPMAFLLMTVLTAFLIPLGIRSREYDLRNSYSGELSDRTNVLLVSGIAFRVLALICLVPTLFRSVRAILREKNADTWDSLLLTPMSRKQIVIEKWWGVLLSERPAFYLMVVILLALSMTGLVSFICSIQILIGIPAMMAFWCALGLYLSSRMRTVFQATTTAVVCVVTFVIFASFMMSTVNDAMEGEIGRFNLGLFFNTMVPAFVGFVLMESNNGSLDNIELGGLLGTFLGSAIHMFFASVLLTATVSRIAREKHGSPQR